MPRIHWPRFEHPRPVEYWADGGLKQLFSTRDGGSTQSYLKVPDLVQAVISGKGNDTIYETQVLDVAVGFKKSSTSRNTGVV
ncbi:hypothetical protein WJX82_009605 [Trebouxia sp. C0006]